MNFFEATQIAALARFESAWENMNPYEDQCDEERCVKGKNCKECNEEVEDDCE